jgi:hypothetical protein
MANALPLRTYFKQQQTGLDRNRDIKVGLSIKAPNSGIRSDEDGTDPNSEST